jgi:hypothetical protein
MQEILPQESTKAVMAPEKTYFYFSFINKQSYNSQKKTTTQYKLCCNNGLVSQQLAFPLHNRLLALQELPTKHELIHFTVFPMTHYLTHQKSYAIRLKLSARP